MVIGIPAELATKIAGTFRGTPALLTLILINTLFMCIIVWAMWTSAEFRFKERGEMLRMIDRCMQSRSGSTGTKGVTDESGTTTPIGTTTPR